MTEAELRTEIKEGPSGVYLLTGEEEYLTSYYLTEIRRAVLGEGDLDSFNHTQINYLDGGFGNLAEAVGMTPFMAERRLCELSGFNFNSAKDTLLKSLRAIIDEAAENEECVLVILADADNFDSQKNSRTQKKVNAILGEAVKQVNFDKTTPQKLANWIGRHFAHEKLTVSADVCAYMVDRCGRSMRILAGEIEKVCAYKHSRGECDVRREDITYLCPRNEEIGAFALANALLEGNTRELFRVLGENKKSGSPLKPKIILASVSSVYMDLAVIKELAESGLDEGAIAKKLKIHEYRVKLYLRVARTIPTQKLEDIIVMCQEADSDMKLLYSDEVVLERLLCAIAALR